MSLCKTSDRGFTLIELLLAIFIFSIVISSVYGAYRSTFSIVHGSEYQTSIAHSAGFVLERIVEDLDSIVLGEGSYFHGEGKNHSGGRGDSLAFISNAYITLTKTDISSGRSMIRYSVEHDDGSGLLNLFRSDMIVFPNGYIGEEVGNKHLLCRGLREVRFTYYDREGNMQTEWTSDSTQTNEAEIAEKEGGFPALVDVELRFSQSVTSENKDVFRTAVSLPQEPDK